jgi:hypothetical protein
MVSTIWRFVNDILERMWKKAAVACFNISPTIQHLFERLRKTTLLYQNANLHDTQNFVMSGIWLLNWIQTDTKAENRSCISAIQLNDKRERESKQIDKLEREK